MEKLIPEKFTGLEKVLWSTLLVTSLFSTTSQYLLHTELESIDKKIQILQSLPEPTNEETKKLIYIMLP